MQIILMYKCLKEQLENLFFKNCNELLGFWEINININTEDDGENCGRQLYLEYYILYYETITFG